MRACMRACVCVCVCACVFQVIYICVSNDMYLLMCVSTDIDYICVSNII